MILYEQWHGVDFQVAKLSVKRAADLTEQMSDDQASSSSSFFFFPRRTYDHAQIPFLLFCSVSSLLLPLCLPSHQTTNNWGCHVNGRELYRSAWPAQTTGRELFADKWDLVPGLSSINWWVLLVEGARYHGGFSFPCVSLWQSG